MMHCSECGREVKTIFDHIAAKCSEWPEVEPATEFVEYRGYKVERSDAPVPHMAWSYVHEDFDGDEDNRYGYEATFWDCLVAIDEGIDD